MKFRQLIFLFLLLSVAADAAPNNIFNVDCDIDLSSKFLVNIFGGTIFNSLCKAAPGDVSYLPEIFKIFNLGLLVFAGGFISYAAITTTLGNASDGGAAAGKNNPWVPLRLATGATLLAPVSSGYSLIQVIVLWAIVQGIGLANSMWDKQVDILESGLPKGIDKGVNLNIESKVLDYNKLMVGDNQVALHEGQLLSVPRMYAVGLCLAVLERAHMAQVSYDNNTPTVSFGVYSDCGEDSSPYKFCAGSNTNRNECGQFTFGNNNSFDSEIALNILKENIINNIKISKMKASFALDNIKSYQRDLDDPNCFGDVCNTIKSMTNNITSQITPFLVVKEDKNISKENSWGKDAKNMGWISGGQYYYKFNNQNLKKTSEFDESKFSVFMPKVLSPFKIKDGSENISLLDNKVINGFLPDSDSDVFKLVVRQLRILLDKGYVSKSIIADRNKVSNTISSSDNKSPIYSGALKLKNLMTMTTKYLPMTTDFSDSVFRVTSVIFPTNLSAPLSNLLVLLGVVTSDFVGLNIRNPIWLNVAPPNSVSGFAFINHPANYGFCLVSDNFSPACRISNVGLIGYLFSYFDVDTSGTVNFLGVSYNKKGVTNVIDPLTNIANIGRSMLSNSLNYWINTTQAVYETSKDLVTNYSATKAAMAAGSGILSVIPGVGGLLGGILSGVSSIFELMYSIDKYNLSIFLPLGVAVSGSFFVLGVILGIYLPMIPFMVFTFTAIGWLMAVIEAMIAAPLVALGVTHPQGHDLLGKAEQSIILLLGIFIRPSAIILGFIAAVALLKQVLLLVNIGFLNLLNSLFENQVKISSSNAIISLNIYIVGIMMIYVYILLAVVNQVFSLVYQVPEKLLRWIGAAPEQTGVAQMMGEIKQGMQSSGQQLSQAGQVASKAPDMQTVDTSDLKKSVKEAAKEIKSSSGSKDHNASS